MAARAGHRSASIAGRAQRTASNAGRAGMRWAGLRPGLPRLAPAGHRWPQAPAGLGRWPQAPAGLGKVASSRPGSEGGLKRRPGWFWLGSAPTCPAVTVPVKDGLNRRPGCRGSRFLRHVGGVGPRRGTSSQTAGCGVNWSMAAVCAVCCGGTPTRPHPTVSYAANRRREDQAVTDNGPLHSDHRHRYSWPQRSIGDGLCFLLPPADRRRRDGRAGSCRGAPAANCTHGRLEATDPAPCSL